MDVSRHLTRRIRAPPRDDVPRDEQQHEQQQGKRLPGGEAARFNNEGTAPHDACEPLAQRHLQGRFPLDQAGVLLLGGRSAHDAGGSPSVSGTLARADRGGSGSCGCRRVCCLPEVYRVRSSLDPFAVHVTDPSFSCTLTCMEGRANNTHAESRLALPSALRSFITTLTDKLPWSKVSRDRKSEFVQPEDPRPASGSGPSVSPSLIAFPSFFALPPTHSGPESKHLWQRPPLRRQHQGGKNKAQQREVRARPRPSAPMTLPRGPASPYLARPA